MAAAATGLGTAELLKTILRNLPTKDLLLAQRVSRFFKNCIDGSVHLQRALFFVLGDALDVHQETRRFWVSLGRDIYYNPFEVTPDAVARLPKDFLTTVKSTGIRMNPLLMLPIYKAGQNGRQLALNVSPSFLSSSLPGSLLSTNESASCKRMYLSQPPMIMDHHITYFDNGGPEQTRVRVKPSGYHGQKLETLLCSVRNHLPEVKEIRGDVECQNWRAAVSRRRLHLDSEATEI